jgi:hypothetical protein
MLDTFDVLTLQLAKAWGIAMLAMSLVALTGPRRLALVIDDFERLPGLAFMAALFALFLGLGLVMLHNLWTDPTAMIVSFLGWLVLVKGLLLLAAPSGLLAFAVAAASSPLWVRFYGFILLVLGAFLLAFGLLGHANPGV